MTTIIAFILMFGALVFVHELGHLIFAKRAGILCREFAIGFGPKILSFKKGETVYTIRLFPIGGFVKMAGEDGEFVDLKPGQRVGLEFNENGFVSKIFTTNFEQEKNITIIDLNASDLQHDLVVEGINEASESRIYKVDRECLVVSDREAIQIAPYDRQFNSKKVGPRALAIFAGPAMNFILAIILLFFVGVFQGVQTDKPIMGKLTPDGVAKEVGFKEGDKVLSINDEKMSSWKQIVGVVSTSPDESLKFKVQRGAETITIQATPKGVVLNEEKIGRIGVYAPFEKNFMLAVKSAFTQTFEVSKQIFVGFGKIITGAFSIHDLSGPVGIYQVTDTVAKTGGIFSLLVWTAYLSINLGVINLLPLPALDGGRLIFFAVEALRGKPIDRQKEGLVHFVGFALLMLLMVVVTWNDIRGLFF